MKDFLLTNYPATYLLNLEDILTGAIQPEILKKWKRKILRDLKCTINPTKLYQTLLT